MPTFITNLVLYSIFKDKGELYIDSENRRLYSKEVTFIFFKRHGGYYLLEDNSASHPIAILAAPPAAFLTDQSLTPINVTLAAIPATKSIITRPGAKRSIPGEYSSTAHPGATRSIQDERSEREDLIIYIDLELDAFIARI